MQLPQNHILAFPRPSPTFPHLEQAFDTTTVAAHDFDVDPRTGFMPPDPPVARLPADWAPWEDALDRAIATRLRVADYSSDPPDPLDPSDLERQTQWHTALREVRFPLPVMIGSN